MYFFYSLAMAVAVLVTLPYWLWQGIRHGKYLSNLRERLGLVVPEIERVDGGEKGAGIKASATRGGGKRPPRKAAATKDGPIWVHAVSVGEALSGIPLAKRLKEMYPLRRLVVSTTTQTGYALAKERMPFADAVIYFPLDWAFCVRRVLDAVNPALVLVLETEIWPNFLREARRRGVPVVFLSGRISGRSFAGYQKYLGMFGFFLRPFLRSALGNAAAFLMQTETDAERIRALGAPAERVTVSGNLKYDMALPEPTPLSAWLEEECRRQQRWPVIVAGSVVATEEPLTLIAFGVVQGDFPKALLVLAPRKPERFAAAADFIGESHRKFVRRSELPIPGPGIVATGNGSSREIPDDVTVLLLDSIGELASLYRIADGAFVGGSLVEAGGHNILEPAAFGKVPVFGPSMENFAAIASRFVEAGAAVQVGSPEDAGVSWIELLKDRERMKRMGDTAKGLVESSRGALDRALKEVAKQLNGAAA